MSIITALAENFIRPKVREKAIEIYSDSFAYLVKRMALILAIVVAYNLTGMRAILIIGSITVWIFFIASGLIRTINNIREISRFSNSYLSPVKKVHNFLAMHAKKPLFSFLLKPFVNLTSNILSAIKEQLYYFICIMSELLAPLVIVYYVITRYMLNKAGITCWEFLTLTIK